MNTIKFEKGNVLVIAHRGLSGLERENTSSAFVAAANRSYFGIETDVHRTSDGNIVIMHDGDLKRVAGVEKSVGSLTMAELESVILYDTDGSKNRLDLRPPRLENYVDICKKYGKRCVLELKDDFTEEEIRKIIRIFEERDYLGEVIFISFIYGNLTRIRKILPSQPVQFLFMEPIEGIVDRLISDRIDADVYYKILTEDMIKALHGAGLRVNVWTVDNKEIGERFASLGVDYITSNILE